MKFSHFNDHHSLDNIEAKLVISDTDIDPLNTAFITEDCNFGEFVVSFPIARMSFDNRGEPYRSFVVVHSDVDDCEFLLSLDDARLILEKCPDVPIDYLLKHKLDI